MPQDYEDNNIPKKNDDNSELNKIISGKQKNPESKQMDLFKHLLKPSQNSGDLSNLLSLWDSFPKYALNRSLQTSMRNPYGGLPNYKRSYKALNGDECTIEISPAKITEKDGSEKDYYPSDLEESIEDLLRRLFLEQAHGIHLPNDQGSWCRFTLRMIYDKLKEQGKNRTMDDIKKALEIMKKATITITINGEPSHEGSILLERLIQNRTDYLKNPHAASAVRFSSLVSKGIEQLDFRQYNYEIMISLKSQLHKYLFKLLSSKFLNAGHTAPPFAIYYSDIEQCSGLLHHSEAYRKMDIVKKAMAYLVDRDVLRSFTEKPSTEGNKVTDILFKLTPSSAFIADMKASNKRHQMLLANRAASRSRTPLR
tara:strand:+ start:23111 stop:24214 length:1104 start_codon:yes stop_codon:yes gene_type:complete